MIDYSFILSINYAGKDWCLSGFDYGGLVWTDSTPKPTQEELDALWVSTQEVIAAKAQDAIKLKDSAVAKLTALGLTMNEITALGIK